MWTHILYCFATSDSGPSGSTATVDVVPTVATRKKGIKPFFKSDSMADFSDSGRSEKEWVFDVLIVLKFSGEIPAIFADLKNEQWV